MNRIRSHRALAALCAVVVAGCTMLPAAHDTPAPSGERIAAIVASPDRSAADRETDARRKPAELLAFVAPRPGMTVVDVSAGGGYTTELMARAVGPTGRVYGQSPPPDPGRAPPAAPEGGAAPAAVPAAPRRTSAMALAERARNPAVANIVPTVRPFVDPVPPEAAGSVDVVTLMLTITTSGISGSTAPR